MSDTDDTKKDATAAGGGEAKATPGRRRKARPVTIDLTPDEVKDESAPAPKAAKPHSPHPPGKAAQAAQSKAPQPQAAQSQAAQSQAAQASSAESASRDARADATARPGDTETGSARAATPQPAGSLPTLLAAGLLGGVATLVIYAALARFGIAPVPAVTAPETTARIVRLETMLTRLSGQDRSAAAAQLSAELATLNKRVATLEETVARAGEDAQADRQAVLGDITARLESMETAATETRSRLTELAARPAAAAAGAIDASALQGRFEADLKTALQSVDAQLIPIRDAVTELRAAIAATPAPQADRGSVAALALAAAGLERAADGGAPFRRELDAVEALTGTNDTITALKPLAGAGVATLARLVQSFDATASRIVTAATAAQGNGLMERFIAGARTMVRVRPAGPVSGDSAGAIVARAEARLKHGDLDGAVAELEALTAAPANAAADWMARARARLAADRLIDTLNQRATADLAGRGAEGSGSARSPQ